MAMKDQDSCKVVLYECNTSESINLKPSV